jgi:hypothetical protein
MTYNGLAVSYEIEVKSERNRLTSSTAAVKERVVKKGENWEKGKKKGDCCVRWGKAEGSD